MTAREIIEARLGRALPPTKDLRPDERKAILLLGRQLTLTTIEPSQKHKSPRLYGEGVKG